MPPSSNQPPVSPNKMPILPAVATAMLIVGAAVLVYEANAFLALTHDLKTLLLNGAARIIFMLAVLSLLWIKRMGAYAWLPAGAAVLSLGFCAFNNTINVMDVFVIGALFLAVLYYKGSN